MQAYRICGSSEVDRAKHKDGCNRLYSLRRMFRCWQCGFLFCEYCYPEHQHDNKHQKGGEK